jgi:hypothetical protein
MVRRKRNDSGFSFSFHSGVYAFSFFVFVVVTLISVFGYYSFDSSPFPASESDIAIVSGSSGGGFFSFGNPFLWFLFGSWFVLVLFFVFSLYFDFRMRK